jgi:hypothetical protein
MEKCSVGEATHVKVGGQIHEISSKWGVKPSGGVERDFGVVTTSGKTVHMTQAELYFKEERPQPTDK